MNNIDYTNLDKLDIYAQKDKANKIIECYQSFSWQLVSNNENEKYENIRDLSFIRPHKIKNKDYLQYNQIEMENILNEIGKLEKKKHAKSTSLGLLFGLISSFFLFLGFYLILYTNVSLFTSIFTIVFALGITMMTTLLSIKIFKKEKIDFENKYSSLNIKLEDICKIVKEKIGETKNDK